ncbi:PST family polysaccharide transporter [Natronobacillus azotifigens]|uniref:Polysaccharide biosynthesis protein n=1 Tax=Natronobacillus azotifigens TaxID=472978 RepID=A0A9J6RDP8_9BACI|nr:polysaccharide biosynthesis protein [Natronobacillus azotifigens]MCZ0703597.1 polysaccharide biosynthesis protein [Natronobacillus azotifigens]
MDKQTERRQFFTGAFLLTYAGLLSKVLSAGYRIPLQNITGDVGFYVYQQIYPFIGIASVLALYGFPAAISKWFASKSGPPTKKEMRNIFFHLALFSLVVFLIVFFSSPSIARMMGDAQLSASIKTSAYIFLLMPFISCLRGIFQGQNNMVPTALSQVMEQVIRVSLIIIAAMLITSFDRPLYELGVGAAVASISGAMIALFTLVVYRKKRNRQWRQVDLGTKIETDRNSPSIIGFGLVMAINHMLLLLLQFVDAFTLVPHLVQSGIPLFEAQVLKGILDRGQPLAQLGIVVASSLTLALIPTVTKARLSDDQERFIGYITSTWRFTLYLAGGATVGLILLFSEVNTLLFKEDVGTLSLQVFSITIVFAALSISTAAILQGLGQIYRTAFFVLAGVIVKMIGNMVLVPYLHITGAAIATALAAVVVFILNMRQLKKILPKQKLIVVPWGSFFLAILLMSVVVIVTNQLGQGVFNEISRTGQLLYVLIMALIGFYTYMKTLIKTNAFTEQELEVLPFMRLFRKDVRS